MMRASTEAWLAAGAVLAALSAAALDRDAFGRVLLGLGLPGPAAQAIGDPGWRGMALHAAGRYAAAEDAFRRAGPAETFNRANALARLGAYGAALSAYDAVLARDPADLAASQDRALVARLHAPVEGEILPGDEVAGAGSRRDGVISPFDRAAPSTGGGSREMPQDRVARPEQPALAQPRVRRGFEAQSIAADRNWLATFPDDAARYLEALIAAEHARRREAGLSPPPPVDPR